MNKKSVIIIILFTLITLPVFSLGKKVVIIPFKGRDYEKINGTIIASELFVNINSFSELLIMQWSMGVLDSNGSRIQEFGYSFGNTYCKGLRNNSQSPIPNGSTPILYCFNIYALF